MLFLRALSVEPSLYHSIFLSHNNNPKSFRVNYFLLDLIHELGVRKGRKRVIKTRDKFFGAPKKNN